MSGTQEEMGVQLKSVDDVPGKTVQVRVHHVLRDAIFSGEFPSEARIRQSEIAQALGVSVSPVREALRDLAAEGLVVFDPHRGAAVASFGLAEFEEMVEIRLALEPIRSRRLLRNITPDQLAELIRIHETIVRSPDRYLELNMVFHQVLEEASDAPRVSAILRSLTNITFVVLTRTVHSFPHRVLEGISEHARIIEAIQENDEDKLVDIVRLHSEATWDLARKKLMEEMEDAAAG